MSVADRVRWDRRYAGREADAAESITLPAVFEPFAEMFPTSGSALELACGRGGVAVWLARRGLTAWGYDVSPVAITQARELAALSGVADLCRFGTVDLDDGLPAGPPVDVLICNRFRDHRLDRPIVERVGTGGILGIAVLSEVGGAAGRFRARAGESRRAFIRRLGYDRGRRRQRRGVAACPPPVIPPPTPPAVTFAGLPYPAVRG